MPRRLSPPRGGFTRQPLRFLLPCFAVLAWLLAPPTALASGPLDTMAERMRACTACHGEQGRAGPDGYYPRLAGKPAGYLYNQLQNFRGGLRHYTLMEGLIAPLSDEYLMEMAQYFSSLSLPYPPPKPQTGSTREWDRARTLVREGDRERQPLRSGSACLAFS